MKIHKVHLGDCTDALHVPVQASKRLYKNGAVP